MIDEGQIVLFRFPYADKSILEGTIGQISTDRLTRIKNRLSDWLIGK